MTIDRPTVPEVLPSIRKLYERSCVGCCLHIVLDDNNVRDDDIDSCINYAIENGHSDCESLGRQLRKMSKTQRLKLSHLKYY